MRRALLAALVVAFSVVALAPVQAKPHAGTFTDHKGTDRPFSLFVPSNPHHQMPLVVFLHGCTQTARDAALGTRWNELAEAQKVVVVYPQQTEAANGAKCWNWFLPEHQGRGGEPAMIVAIAKTVMASLHLDAQRVYVAGISAGADMATILGVTYPEVFAAVMPFAGCAFATCSDGTGQAAAALLDRAMPTMVVQGTADPLNNLAMGETAVRQWVATNHIERPSMSTTAEQESVASQDGGEPGGLCDYSRNYPCVGPAVGLRSYPVTIDRYVDSKDDDGACALVEAWYIHGLAHNYPGGLRGEDGADPSFTDPTGPDLTSATWSFFARHRLGDPCGARS